MNDTPLATPGARLRFMRKAKGMTQVTLAAKVHTVQPAISQWEKDKWLPGPQSRRLLAEVLGTTQGFLFGDDVDGKAA